MKRRMKPIIDEGAYVRGLVVEAACPRCKKPLRENCGDIFVREMPKIIKLRCADCDVESEVIVRPPVVDEHKRT